MKNRGVDVPRHFSKTMPVRPGPYYLGHLMIYLGLLLVLAVAVWLTIKAGAVYLAYRNATTHLAALEARVGSEAPPPDSLTTLVQEAEAGANNILTMHNEAAPFLWLLPRLGWLPGYGPDLQALPLLLAAGRDLGHGSLLILDSLQPALNGARDGPILPQIGSRLAQRQEALAAIRQRLVQHQTALVGLPDGQLTPDTAAVANRLEGVLPAAIDSLTVAQNIPTLLGFEGPRTYLIITQNVDELRPAGGYINTAGHITFDRGQISEFVMQDSYAVDRLSPAYPYPPEPIYRYMAAEYWVLRDAAWSPDFPTAAQTIIDLYALGQNVTAEGVIALDQHALPYLLQATGPLQVEGEQVTSRNVIRLMQQRWAPAQGQSQDAAWWQTRKSFMLSLAEAMIRYTFEQQPESLDYPALLVGLGQALAEKHLLIYLDDPILSQLLRSKNWAGALVEKPGDYLFITDANLGFNKASAKIERHLAYGASLADDGSVQARLRVAYRHTGQPRGEPCAIDIRYDPQYVQNMERCYWNYLSLIVPAKARLVSAPQISVDGRYLLRGELTGGQLDRLALSDRRQQWSQLTLLPPGQRLELDYVYELPPGTAEPAASGHRYSLYLQKQPGALHTTAEIRLSLPAGTKLVSSQPQPTQTTPSTLIYNLDLNTDREIQIIYR